MLWISGNGTGISSQTIWCVMMGTVTESASSWRYDTPSDDDDFGRCYRLLKFIPEWRNKLDKVGKAFPKWQPIIRQWDELTRLHEQHDHKGVYNIFRDCYDECMELAGFKKTGPGSWKRDSGATVTRFGV